MSNACSYGASSIHADEASKYAVGRHGGMLLVMVPRVRLACVLATIALAASGCGVRGSQPVAAAPATAHATPSLVGPPPGLIPETWTGIHNFQVFDTRISPSQATQDAYRYDLVWGTNQPAAWKAGNPAIVTMFYGPFDADFTRTNKIGWWLSHHADWILYRCDEKTPAWPGGLHNVPLDISNPLVVQWQMQTYAPVMESEGDDGLAADLVGLSNDSGGCGVFVNGVWPPRFTGQKDDDAWAQAVLKWMAAAATALHSQERPLALGINHVPESRTFGDPEEMTLLNEIDFDDDESSFTNYGNNYVTSQQVAKILQYMSYLQGLDKPFIVDDKWNTKTVDDQQLGWSIATYLLGKDHFSTLFTDHQPGYGYEYWYPQYAAAVGSPCGPAIADPIHKGVYTRMYDGSYVLVNASATVSYTLTLPKPSYQSIFGGRVTSPVTIGPDTGDVLLTTHGCH